MKKNKNWILLRVGSHTRVALIFDIAFYEAKHNEKQKMKNISHLEKYLINKNRYSESKIAEFNYVWTYFVDMNMIDKKMELQISLCIMYMVVGRKFRLFLIF